MPPTLISAQTGDKIAEIAWVVAILLLAMYEGYALVTGKETLSRVVWNANRTQYGPLIPFVAGFLCAHFFFSGQ